jgi:uncharacterized protein (DUF362 family)
MKRRDFFKKSVGASITAAFIFKLGDKKLWARIPKSMANYDLVAVKGGDPATMFDRGIVELGGIKTFVKPNQTVVVKPNIGWDTTPERAADTNPALIKRIVERCLQAGAKEVYVFDNTINNWSRSYKNSGIEKAVKDANGKIIPANTENYYQQVTISKGKMLKSAKVHELILEADVFINVPVLKSHSSTRVSIALKNLMGIVWDRRYWHRNDLNQCIADFGTFHRKPDLNVVDAYNVIMRNGPRGVSKSDVTNMKSQIISTDIVAADAAATKMFGTEPDSVSYIRMADEMGVGTKNLERLSISRIKI